MQDRRKETDHLGFRILELSTPAEIHIHSNQLTIEQQDTSFTIPVEDLDIIIASGSNIRLSTMDISILAENNVLFMTIGKDDLPTSMTLTFRSSSRQSLIMRRQLELPKRRTNRLWDDIIRAKIMNQADALRLLDIPGSEDVRRLIRKVSHGGRSPLFPAVSSGFEQACTFAGQQLSELQLQCAAQCRGKKRCSPWFSSFLRYSSPQHAESVQPGG